MLNCPNPTTSKGEKVYGSLANRGSSGGRFSCICPTVLISPFLLSLQPHILRVMRLSSVPSPHFSMGVLPPFPNFPPFLSFYSTLRGESHRHNVPSRFPARPRVVFWGHQDRPTAHRRVEMARILEDRPPPRRGLEGRRGARRTEPPNAAGKVGRGPSNRLPSALGQLEIFTPVDGHRDSLGD